MGCRMRGANSHNGNEAKPNATAVAVEPSVECEKSKAKHFAENAKGCGNQSHLACRPPATAVVVLALTGL